MDACANLQKLFTEVMGDEGMAPAGAPVMVAVSGGLDSMCLLHLMFHWAQERDTPVIAATVDHKLRPFGEERAAVSAFCADLGVKHLILELEPGLPERGAAAAKSLAHAARDERYAALNAAAAGAGAARIALAHHANDQAETVLLRLLRGTGLTGLSPMRPLSESLYVRPLLQVMRRDLEAYAGDRRIPFVEDPTNSSPRFLRNRVRSEVIPVLENLGSEAVEVISRSAAVMGDELDAMATIVDDLLDRAVEVDERGISVAVDKLGDGSVRRLLIHRLLGRAGDYPPENRHVLEVERLLCRDEGSRQLDLPGNVVVRREYADLRITSPAVAAPDYELVLPGPGEYMFPLGIVRVGRVESVSSPPPDTSTTALFAGNEVVFPLHLRPWRKGDRIWPFRGQGTTLVSDLLIDRKVPRAKRCFVPILTDQEGVLLWVVGLRRSSHWPVSPGMPALEVSIDLT